MALFDTFTRDKTARHREVWGHYERIYTVIDFLAALSFVVGSILFFYRDLQHEGTWLFLIGSILFAAKPSVRVLREFHLARLPLPEDDDV